MPDHKSWEPWEVGVLIENYQKGGTTLCRQLLPHRSGGSIRKKASILGLKSPNEFTKAQASRTAPTRPKEPRPSHWTQADDAALKRSYSVGGVDLVYAALNAKFTMAEIEDRAQEKGVVPPPPGNLNHGWSAGDLLSLLRIWPSQLIDDICSTLGKSESSVFANAEALRLVSPSTPEPALTPEQRLFIERYSPLYGTVMCARFLGRSPEQVRKESESLRAQDRDQSRSMAVSDGLSAAA